MKTIPETILNLLLEQNYIESAEQFKIIDDWHYEMFGDLKLWLKHEHQMATMFDEALEKEGYNIRTTVKLAPKDDDWFCIDLSEHEFPPYYLQVTYNRHYESFDEDILVTRDKKDFYLPIIQELLTTITDLNVLLEMIRQLIEDDYVETGVLSSDYDIIEIHPKHLLHDGFIAAELPFYGDEVQYIDLPDLEDADDPEEVREEFLEELIYNEGKYLFYLDVSRSGMRPVW
jgi:hypothetical protein